MSISFKISMDSQANLVCHLSWSRCRSGVFLSSWYVLERGHISPVIHPSLKVLKMSCLTSCFRTVLCQTHTGPSTSGCVCFGCVCVWLQSRVLRKVSGVGVLCFNRKYTGDTVYFSRSLQEWGSFLRSITHEGHWVKKVF